jgi:hypothetical protein
VRPLGRGPRELRQRGEHRPVDQRQRLLKVGQARVVQGQGLGVGGQLVDHGPQQRGVERVGRLGERAEAEAFDADGLGDVGQADRALQGAHGADQRVEEVEHDQGGVAVEVEQAVAGRVATAADLVEACEERQEPREVLEAADLDVRRVRRRGIRAVIVHRRIVTSTEKERNAKYC